MTRPLRIPIDHDDEEDHDDPVVTSPEERKQMREKRREEAEIRVEGYSGREGGDLQVSIRGPETTPEVDEPDQPGEEEEEPDADTATMRVDRETEREKRGKRREHEQEMVAAAMDRVESRLREKGVSEWYIRAHHKEIRAKVRAEISRDES